MGRGLRYSMKVLHVIPAVAASYGGPSQAIIEICHASQKAGITVEIATTNADGKGKPKISNEIFLHKNIPTHFFPRTFNSEYKFSWRMTKWLEKNVRKFDLLHIHSIFCYSTTIAAHFAGKFNVPYIIRPAGVLDPWPMRQHRLKKQFYLDWLERSNLNHAAAIHCTSEKERESVVRFGFEAQPVVLSLSLEIDEKFRNLEKGLFRKRHSKFGNKKLIVFLSRIHKKKGIELLIDSLSRIRGSLPDFLLVIAGNGRDHYERLIKKKIKESKLEAQTFFTGFLQDTAKYQLLKDADLFVLPSYQENFGFSVIEAMQMGVPVIVSCHVDISKEIESFKAGRAIPCDAGTLGQTIHDLLKDDSERCQMGENAKRLVAEKFGREKMTEGLLLLYQSILEKRKPALCAPSQPLS